MDRECPMCDAVNEPMGELGSLIWYRCRDCGAEYSVEREALYESADIEE